MEQKIIKIKCPHCGVVLSVKDEPGLNEKSTTCPVCEKRSQIKDFKRVVTQQEEKTHYPGMDAPTQYATDQTQIKQNPTKNNTLGKLKVLPNGPSFQLRPGRCIVGRRHEEGAHADFEIITNCKRMSRQHLVIEVKKEAGTGFVHYISLYGQKANATFVGENKLEVGDCLVLNDGDTITLPDMPDINVRFEIPDSEKTEIDS